MARIQFLVSMLTLPKRGAHTYALATRLFIGTLLVLALLLGVGQVAHAQDDNAILDLGKGVLNNVASVESGEEFEYALSYSCSSINVACENVVLVDTLPTCINVIDVITTVHVESWGTDANILTITFVDPLPGGSSGIIRVLVEFAPGTIPGDPCAQTMPVVNHATITADNAPSRDADAGIELEEGNFEMFAQKDQLNEAVVGEPITFEVQLCSPDDIGGVPLTNPTFIDTLPPGAEFVSATIEGMDPPDFVYDPVANTVTWNNLPDPWPVGDCLTREITIIYNELPDPNVPQENDLAVTGIPHGCEPGWTPQASYCDPDDPTVVLTDTNIFELELPFGRWGVGKSAESHSSFLGSEAIPGEQIDYELSIQNTGFLTLTDVVITDTLPLPQGGFTAGPIVVDSVSFSPFSGTTSISAFYKLRGEPAVVPFPSPGPEYDAFVTLTLDDLGLPPGSDIEYFRWEVPEAILPLSYWEARILATVRYSAETNSLITNCLDVFGIEHDPGPPPVQSPLLGSDCANTEIIEARAIPRIEKDRMGPPAVDPGATVNFRVRMFNDNAANIDVVGPVIMDLFPPEYDFVEGSQQVVATVPATVPVPISLEVIEDFAGTGRTLLRASWAPDALIPPGGSVTLEYAVVVKEGTPPGTVFNLANLLTNTPPEVTLGCQGEERYVDDQDLDSDGNATETGCKDIAQVTVNVQLSVDTRKYVRGHFETEFSDFGRSPQDGNVDYRIVLTNTSNVPLTTISLVDIFPWVGDSGVIDQGARNSDFTLVPQFILAASNIPLTVWYTQSTNPCRPDMVPGLVEPNCDDPQWSLDFPIDPALGVPNRALVGSVRVNVCDDTVNIENPTNCYELPRYESLVLVWRMSLPAGEPGSEECLTEPVGPNCPVAWNSFAFRASGGGLPFRPSEPPKVGIAITPPIPLTFGDHVWYDISDVPNNGIQGPTEVGIDGVQVLLFDARTMTVLDQVITGPDALGRPGYYRFLRTSVSPLDQFRLGFQAPEHLTPSPPLQGSDRLLDSDGITVTTIPTISFPFVLTDIITFTAGITEDLSFDQGFWAPLDFGDAPQGTSGSTTYNYPTAIAGSVEFTRAARHAIVNFPGLTVILGAIADDESDGQPNQSATGDDIAPGEFYTNTSPADEDGVRFPTYVDSPTGRIGILTRGSNSTLVISTTIDLANPIPTPYLQGWIDFNRNWDWEYTSNERVIYNRVPISGTQNVSIVVPADAQLGETYARFRLGRRSNLEPWGTVAHGEVEDYRIQIVGSPEKSIVATSEAHTPPGAGAFGNNTPVAVGEVVRYRLTGQLPRGILTNLRMVDAIPNGLMYLGNPVVTLTATTPSSITATIFTPSISPGPFGSGTDVTFDFGTITNSSEGDGVEFVNVEFNVLVLNEAANQDTQSTTALRNNFTLSYADYSALSNNVDVAVFEPSLVVEKTNNSTTLTDAGDVITYTLTAQNLPAARRTTAFDVVISDTIDSDLALDPGSIIVTTTPPGLPFTNTSSGQHISITVAALASGQAVQVTYRAIVAQSVEPRQIINNRLEVDYSSLPGPNGTTTNPTGQSTPGASGALTGERNGTTAPTSLNNYFRTDDTSFAVASPAFVKRAVDNPWTIGEPITFTLVITTIEGTNPAVVLTDTLPPGLGYTGYSIERAGFTGAFANDPPIVTPLNPSTPPTTTVFTLDFGNIVSDDDNIEANNVFSVVVETVVLNFLSNQHGVTMQNSAAMAYTDADDVRRVIAPPAVNVNLIEPTLTIDKSVDWDAPADAGDVVTYTVIVRHAPTSTIPAFNTLLTDTAPAGLTNINVITSAIVVTATGVSTPLVPFTDTHLQVPANPSGVTLLPGEELRLVYTAEIADDAMPRTIYTNTAGVVWATLPADGDPFGERRYDGEGRPDGENLLNSGALNDYEVNDSALFEVDGANAFAKLQPDNPWTIGQHLTFTLVITAFEGTSPNVIITDSLPAGLRYVNSTIVTDGNPLLVAPFNGTFSNASPLPPVVNAPDDEDPSTVTWSLGDMVNPGDNLSTNDTFLIEIEVVVTNILSNQHGVTRQNSAQLTHTDGLGETYLLNAGPVDVNIVEPVLRITKSVDYVEPADAGDIITYTVVVRHAPTSTITAYETLITDTLPAILGTITNVTTEYSGTNTVVAGAIGGTLRVPAGSGTFDMLPGDVITVTYTAAIADDVPLGIVITNTAGAIWATLPTGNPDRRDDGFGSPDRINLLDSGALDDYEVNASAEIRTEAVPDIIKLPPLSVLTIGQHVTFTLLITMPEGILDDVVVTDTLPPGLGFIGQRVVTDAAQSGGLLDDSYSGTFENPPTVTPSPVSPADTATVVWNFGSVTTPGDNDPTTNRFLIQIEAVVLNEIENQHGVEMENSAALAYTNTVNEHFVLNPSPVLVRLVEPELAITKDVEYISPAQAGDVMTFTITLRHIPTSTLTAYSTMISDTVPPALTNIAVQPIEYTGGPLDYALIGNSLRVPSSGTFDLAPSDVVTITFTAEFAVADAPGQVITNTAGAVWASLPPQFEERRWDGLGYPNGEDLIDSNTLNNYEVNDSAQVTFEARPTFAKLPVENPWTIGEYITFTLVVTTVEGTLPNVVVTDTLPEGLGFVSQRVITDSAQSGGLLAQSFAGSFASSPPTVLPAPQNPPTSTTVVWSFGNIVNPADASSSNETFLVQVRTVVLNIIENQHGVSWQNSAAMAYTDGTNARVVLSGGPVDVDLIEPVLAIAKSADWVDPLDAGDPVTYTITLRHVPTSTIPAFNVLLTDTIPFEIGAVQVLTSTLADGTTVPWDLASGALRVPQTGDFTLVPTDTLTIVFTGILSDEADAGVVFTNTAGAIWASLPPDYPQRRHDGVGTPDTQNLLDSGALNDYEVNATALVTPSVEYTITKALVSTSAAHTPGSDLTIGEVVTYSIRVTVSEGRIVRPVITDTLPIGLAWTGAWDADLSAFVGTISEPTVTGQIGVSGAPVVFAAGEQIVSGDNITATNTLTLYLSAVVLDVPTNIGLPGNQTLLDNVASMTANNLPPENTNIVTIQVVEPRMEITKVITPSVSAPQGIVTVTLVISNSGLSTAFETEMEDILPAGLTYAGGASEVAGNGASAAVITTSLTEVSASWTVFPTSTQSIIQFYARLDTGLASDTIILNTATVQNATTLPGDDPNERTEPPDSDSDDVRVINHDLVLSKVADEQSYRAGGVITWTIVVTNVGEAIAPGVVITDIVPDYTFFDSSVNPNWYTDNTFTTPCADGDPPGTECWYSVGDMASGMVVSTTFGLRVIESLPDPAPVIVNAACASDDGSLGVDPTPDNNCDEDDVDFVLAQLGDRVWIDRNGNGIQEVGEFGFPGMTINLHTVAFSGGVSTTTFLSTTTSNLLGHYSFTNLAPGDYQVEFVPMADPLITRQFAGDDITIDSNADPVTGRTEVVALAAGEINDTIDGGVYYLSAIGDFVWDDLNANGVQDAGEPGIPDIGVHLLVEGSVISSTITDEDGFYLFTDLDFGDYSVRFDRVPGYFVSPQQASGNDATDSDPDPISLETRTLQIRESMLFLNFDAGFYRPSMLGDFVWEDLNSNGIQEAGEPPIAGVTVELLSGGAVISTTVTDGSGLYLFEGLDVGSYRVRFVSPAGHHVTRRHIGGDRTIDSDIDPITNATDAISVTQPITDLTRDAGFYRPVTIGDRVWRDHNANGLQEIGEPGIAGVSVTLLYTDGTPVAAESVGAAQTIATDANGLYLFTDIAPGSYVVQIVRPAGMVNSPALQGNNPAIDSDIDPITQRSGVVSQISGGVDLTIDAGFYITGAIGSYAWMDISSDGVRDAGEPPAVGVVVHLLRAGETTPLLTTTTDAEGLFLFDDLAPGAYLLHFEAPQGYLYTMRIETEDPMTNSDVNQATGLTANFDLPEGVVDLTWGAGFIVPTNDPDTPEPDGGAFQLWLPSVQHQP